MPIVDHGDIAKGDPSTRQGAPTCAGAALDQRTVLSGAMIQQREGHGLQSRPQQFVRLVGGHRRPAV